MFDSETIFFRGEQPFTATEVNDAIVTATHEARAFERLGFPLDPNVKERATEAIIDEITARTCTILDSALADGESGLPGYALQKIRVIVRRHILN